MGEWLTFLGVVVTAIATIICAVVMVNGKKHAQQADDREKALKNYMSCLISLVVCDYKLTQANTAAIKNGKVNGELTEAENALKEAKKEHSILLRALGLDAIL